MSEVNDHDLRRVLGLLSQDDTLRGFSALVLGLPGDPSPKALQRLAATAGPDRADDQSLLSHHFILR
ncbi:hypothetical protein [Nonomuraea sp. B1E8]|uniref:hypothetical protein n=1 Tax=unclassified Nonomuraea TaxID=2593643 RepID=UPI00325ED41A